MCVERFVCECPYRSTIEHEGKRYTLPKELEPQGEPLMVPVQDQEGKILYLPYDTVVISHYLSHADALHLYREGKSIPECHEPFSPYE